jgi:hypothetical protein
LRYACIFWQKAGVFFSEKHTADFAKQCYMLFSKTQLIHHEKNGHRCFALVDIGNSI